MTTINTRSRYVSAYIAAFFNSFLRLKFISVCNFFPKAHFLVIKNREHMCYTLHAIKWDLTTTVDFSSQINNDIPIFIQPVLRN